MTSEPQPLPPRSPASAARPVGTSRRSFLRLAGAAAAAGALSACSAGQRRPAATEAGKVQLVYQDWRTDWFPPMARELLERFHATHPNIRVYYTPDPEDLTTRMLADFRAGTAPDVFQGCCTHFPAWAQMGYCLDLRPYTSTDLDQATLDDWDPAQVAAFHTRDGLQFGLPKYHGALALYYNKDLLALYGVDRPDASWDHDDYAQAMLLLTQDQNDDGRTDLWGSMLDVSWDRIQVHVNGWGGHLIDPADPARCAMAEPPALRALDWIRARMWDDRVMATPRDVQRVETRQAFSSGRVVMVEDGSWALKDILARANFRVGVAPLPAGPVRRVTLATSDGFGIFAGTRHPEAAWELVKFLVSQEYGRAMAQASFLQPARASLVGEWVGFIRAGFPGKIGETDIGAFADGHLKGYSVTTEVAADMQAAQAAAQGAWERILVLGQGAVQDIEPVCRGLDTSG